MPQFKPGQSGNPKGRPTDHAKAAKIRKQILAATPDVVAGLIESAKAGDVLAGRTLLACACPPLKPVELPVMVSIPPDASLVEQGQAIIAALAQGHIPPSQAQTILQSLVGLARLVELSEIEQRLTALESQAGNPPRPTPPWVKRDE